MLALRALNRKSFKLYYVRIYEPFQNINSALFEVSVKGSSYSSQCVDSTERLRASITRDIWTCERELFFITKTLSLGAVVKEESMNYPPETTGPCQEWKERGDGGKGKGSSLQSGGIQGLEGSQENVSAWAGDPARRCHSLCPVNWNTKQSGVDERAAVVRRVVVRGGVCCLSPATLNLHCSLGIDWGASKRDRHTVTGKMNCHLAFLNLLAASNWPLWTMWRDTDWVLVFPSWAPEEGAGLISSVQPLHAKHPGRGSSSFASNLKPLHRTSHGRPILPHHPSLFHCAASLLCLSAGLVFLTACSHGGLTATRRRKTIRCSHLDPGGNPGEY